MPKAHSKNTVVIIGGYDLTEFANNSQKEFSTDTHDTTTYGKSAHVFDVGLDNGKGTVSGFYDKTASTGPRAAIMALRAEQRASGAKPRFVHRPEGNGSGLPQDAVDVIIEKYTETAPVADYVTFAIDLQFSDDVDSTPQS